MVINSETFYQLLDQSASLQDVEITEFKSVLEKYPYFQPARALYLKKLKNQDSFRYNNELKITAAHTIDRAVLFDFVTSNIYEQRSNIHQEIAEKIEEVPPSIPEEEPIQEIEENLEIGKPISFAKSETHSFNEWLQLSVQKPIQREETHQTEKTKPNVDKFSLIDKFIKSNPKIVPVEKGEKVEISIPKNKTDKSLMTQTLAKVYLEQKKYAKAIKAYEILSLKYPEKSGFFADQIKRIKILQKNKS